MRKLASIQRILDIQPIEKADRIETVSVLGWKVVVPKGQFPNAMPDQEREGIVIRSKDHKISFKVTHNRFLLRGGDEV